MTGHQGRSSLTGVLPITVYECMYEQSVWVDNCVCSAAEIEQLQLIAKKSELIVIPLIQTFGHFEVFFFVPFV